MTDHDPGFIHRWVPSHDIPDRTTLLLLHGTGGDETDLLSLGRMLHERAALLSPRGKVTENGMARFFRRIAEGVFDVPDLKARAQELGDFVTAAAERYGFDPAHVVAVGFSNGANIAAGLMLLRPDLFRAAVLLSPMVPFVPDPLPALPGTPVFIGAGRLDPVATPDGTRELGALLERAGAEVTFHWHAGAHMVTPEEMAAAREWLRTRV